MSASSYAEGDNVKRMSAGLYVNCPYGIKEALQAAFECGFHFIVTQLIHPNFERKLDQNIPSYLGRTDRILRSSDWTRLIVGEVSRDINVDSEVGSVQRKSKKKLLQELGFASHLGLPAVLINLSNARNTQLGQILYGRLLNGNHYNMWVSVPMIHPSRYSPIYTPEEQEDTWDWWNDLRRYCNYDKRLGVVLELPDVKHAPTSVEVDRWLGEPVKAFIIPTSYFLTNHYGKPVLSRTHQEIIQKFLTLNVQYIIKSDHDSNLAMYTRYIQFLGKKLFVNDSFTAFAAGCEDFLQNPLQPLTEHLETTIYEVFEKDEIKYTKYQHAIQNALEDVSATVNEPVVMVLGAGRGPLVQAALNVAVALKRKIKLYAVEKNPFAINTLIDRVENEWNNQVTLISEDMRTYEPPEKADIIVSELLGSFGDNELSPECLDGAQRFLKQGGTIIPSAYTSYLAPLQSIKIYNEIKANRSPEKSLLSCFEMPYIVHVVNFYQIAAPQPLFKFVHPNWNEERTNERYKRLKFACTQDCVLTGFVGYFDANLYKGVMLSINPETHTKTMVSWFPIIFPLPEPVHVSSGCLIEISFWRVESDQNVWYEWCLESPVKGHIMNPNGRSFSMKKY